MKLSIVIGNHNYADFIENAIRSALDQDYADKEVIVVDDGSTDASREIIERWRHAVKIIFKDNAGQISAYNAGLSEVTGDVVIFLDSDDLLDRDVGSRIVAEFADARVAKVHFRMRLVDRAGRELGGAIPSRLDSGDLGDRLRVRGEMYLSAPGSGNAYRVELLRRLAPLPESPTDHVGADFYAIYGISLLGEVRSLGTQTHGSYRVHRDGSRNALSFGNAAQDPEAISRMKKRYDRLRTWVAERLGPEYELPAGAPDFSLEKQRYAAAIFSADSYLHGFNAGKDLLFSSLLPSIWLRRESRAVQVGLVGWALAVLVLPRKVGMPVARYVCNPANR